MPRFSDICDKKLKIGDWIVYRPDFEMSPPVLVKITELTRTWTRGDKYGDHVDEVTYKQVYDEKVLFGLDNGRWCYSSALELNDTVKANWLEHEAPSKEYALYIGTIYAPIVERKYKKCSS